MGLAHHCLDLSYYSGMTPQIRQYLKGGEQLPVGHKTPAGFWNSKFAEE